MVRRAEHRGIIGEAARYARHSFFCLGPWGRVSVFLEDESNYPRDMNISTSGVSREQFKASMKATGVLLRRVARLIRQTFGGDHRTKAGTPRKRFDDQYIHSIVLDAFIQVFA